ncbi:dihydrofolate reductase family protein [Subtercola frigoramans]|uniref:Dihydrofolate reductase n=1 Tax=Subtercola frigoramans TaxID=120298 RepID=A0ABS2L7T0_9MICO|nr:dihydrofolate reductase family protein [Subtercola frigoramans]MBM7473160.1 dihydrofolate reductase [Subtercola frigoramans]
MNLTISIQVSVDGVMQANGGNDDELDPGFARGGWAIPTGDAESFAYIVSTWQRADAFLLGRKTYSLFAQYWGGQADDSNPFSAAMNPRPKYVVSNSLTEPEWANTTVISGDIAAGIRELKARPGGELVVVGSGMLARWLLENELVDEINLIVCPVIVGDGLRLFPQQGRDFALELVESKAFPTGVLAQTYRTKGRPTYA